MIDRLRWIEAKDTYPYYNLALEEYLTMHAEPGECILYLWQNRHTVVIGKNQNCWKECKVDYLEDEGGYLVRRMSGGGAVFHDLGNLNFTFLVRKKDYDVDRQLDVILEAVKMLGIHAEKTGRNDITVDGKKFSGNAFYETGDFCYHHGTLLLHVNKGDMSKYLNVSKEKLQSKSVDSVRSRVTNLCDYNPGITVEIMKQKMTEAFGQVYGGPVLPLEDGRIDRDEIKRLEEKFSSWEWKYGRKIPFDHQMGKRYDWGDVEIQLHVNGGRILAVNVYSDAMDQEIIGELPDYLRGCLYSERDMAEAIRRLSDGTEEKRRIKEDLLSLLHEAVWA